MKNLKYIIGTLLLVISTFSCATDELDNFSGADGVYFQWAKDGVLFSSTQVTPYYIDSTNVSFAYELPSVTDSVFKIPVKLQGYLSNEDRPFNVNVLNSSTAVRGFHYDLPDTFVMPANKNIGYIPVTLHRTDDLSSSNVVLELELTQSAYFHANSISTKIAYGTNREVRMNQFTLQFNDILTEPAAWSSLSGWLGTFSAKKLYLFAEVNNIPVPNYTTRPALTTFLGQIAVFKAYLTQQKNNGTPVKEDDGSNMTLGPSA